MAPVAVIQSHENERKSINLEYFTVKRVLVFEIIIYEPTNFFQLFINLQI